MKTYFFILVLLTLSPAVIAQSTTFTIESTADDYGEEKNSDGSMYLSSSDVEMCYDSYNGGMQTVGFHFSGVSVPQGATISTSYIQFTADESQSGTSFTITIEAEDVDNASAFSSTDYDISSRTTTSASVTWNPPAWTSGDAGSAQKSPSLNSIIQEVVNRSGWAGDGLTIIITANTGSSSNHRTAEVDPVLHIEYSANAEDVVYYVSDDDDALYKLDVNTGNCELIGGSNFSSIEAIANWPSQSGYTLYATDAGVFGTLDFSTGAFTSIGQVDGGGTADGSDGPQQLNDVNGLAFDARTGILWASNRRGSSQYDLLFQIDPATGHFIEDAFGPGKDYLEIDGSGIRYDIDDIAVSPVNGKMYCTNNDGGTNDQILEINKATGAISVESTFASMTDVEGADFFSDGTFYCSEGNGNSVSTVVISTGASTTIKDPLCGNGDVEALATLVSEANLISGNVWEDTDLDGIKDAGETTGLSNVTIKIYYDANGNGQIDGSDEYLNSVKTNSSGDWEFEYATTGHLIATVETSTLPSGYALTTGNIQTANFTTFGQTDVQNNFGANTDSDCDGDGIPDFADGNNIDSDGDGIYNKCDLDSDNDGILDSEEWTEDTDGDGIKDFIDLDSDNDGIPDAIEANNGVAPTGYSSSTGRITGSDSDNDGLLNSVDNAPNTAYGSGSTSTLDRKDHDGDGVKDFVDLDSDNDGILDIIEAGGSDSNGDGKTDSFSDSNNDGYHDAYTSSPLAVPNTDSSTEAVALPNYIDQDSDGDGIDDLQEGLATCGIDTPCFSVPSNPADEDGDGILNDYDISVSGSPVTPYDKDGDGTPDYIDSDSDNDGISDRIEGDDANNDQVADSSPSGTDSNKNGIDDEFDNFCSGVTTLTITRDDYAEETNSNGSMYLTSSDLELCYDGHLQTVGVHFNAVNVPQGATITKAYIQFQVDEATTGSVTVTIEGQDADNPSTFSSTDYDVTSRTRTSASVSWSPPDWNTVGDEGADQQTSELKTIVQEIVNRSGWSSGNSMVFIFSNNNTSAYRTAENNPKLVIEYEGGMSYACGTDVPVQDNDGDGEADFRDDTDDSGNLPIMLLDIAVDMDGDAARLDWNTSSEINNNYFVVERSKDHVNWEKLGIVKGAGNSNTVKHYVYYDYKPHQGPSYYRLQQIDFDGSTTISKVVSLANNNSSFEVKIYPNPAKDLLTVESSEKADIEILSMAGKKMFAGEVSKGRNVLNLSTLQGGIYLIKIITTDEIIVKRLVIGSL